MHQPSCTIASPCDCPNILHVDCLKYLGVLFDSHLTWKNNIKKVHGTLRSLNVLFYNLKKFMPRQAMVKIYIALFQSRMQYGLLLWGSAAQVWLKPIVISQKFAVRSIAGQPRFAHTAEIFKQLTILPLSLLYKKIVLQNLMTNNNNNNVSETVVRNTRQGHMGFLTLPNYSKAHTRTTFLYKSIGLHNELCRMHHNTGSKKSKKNFVISFINEQLLNYS